MGDDERSRLAQELKQAFARLASASRSPVVPVPATPAPRERGIGFSADLLAAVLAGRKTETRRPVRPAPADPSRIDVEPPALVGDRLWVREGYARLPDGTFAYARDGRSRHRFTPARFMPRDAARVFLRVTSLRVERLQAIDEAAAVAEGFAASPLGNLSARDTFLATWDTFYGATEFAAQTDPLVWVIGLTLEPV